MIVMKDNMIVKLCSRKVSFGVCFLVWMHLYECVSVCLFVLSASQWLVCLTMIFELSFLMCT